MTSASTSASALPLCESVHKYRPNKREIISDSTVVKYLTGRERLIRSHLSARFSFESSEIRIKLRPVIQILAKTSN